MKAQDLKCCGNCHNKSNTKYNPFGCLKPGAPDEVCQRCAWDKKTWMERCSKSEKIQEEMRNN